LGERSERQVARRLLIDLAPLRRSRDLRCLVLGELGSVLGTQLTTVAVPYQVYQLTHSSLDIGLVSLAQLFPLIAGSLLGGSAVDAMDRRRLLMVAQVMMAGCSAGLAVNANLGTSLWPLFVLPALAAGFGGLDDAARSAIVPNLVQRSEVPTANATFQALFQFGLVAGPAVAGRCWPARGSGSCTGWTWPASGRPCWRRSSSHRSPRSRRRRATGPACDRSSRACVSCAGVRSSRVRT
jgi:MFS family permease